MANSRFLSYEFGSLSLQNFESLNGARIIDLGDPIELKDAVNKRYVDNSIQGSNLAAGIGISIVNNNINVNSSQTQIRVIGTIQTGIWNASTIQIPYGGTGQSAFSANKILWYSGNNSLNSAQELTFDTTSFVTSVPIYINNTSNITNLNDTIGSLIVNGGTFIKKNFHVLGNSFFESGVTVGSLTINGNISLASINANSAICTSITTSTLNSSTINVSSYLVSFLTSTNNLITTNSTLGNVNSNFINVTNLLNTNLTTTNIISTGIGIFNSASITSISTGLINVTNQTVTNLVMTNISGGTVRATSFVNTPNLINGNATISNLISPNIQCNIANIASLNSTTANLINVITTNSNSVNNTRTNILASNISSSNLSITNTINATSFSGSSVYLSSIITVPNIANQNTTITNLTSQNSILTFASVGSIRVSGISNLANITLSTATASNIFINNFLTSTFNNFVGVTVNNLNCTSFGIFSTINSISTSTGTLFSNESINVVSSIGTLNVSGNFNNSNGNIYTSVISTSNLYSSTNINGNNTQLVNLTTNNLNVNGILSQNTSTGTLNISGLTQTLQLVSTNQTNTNILNTNISSGSAKINTISIGNSYIINNSVANNIVVNNVTTNSSISSLIISSNATFNKNILLGSTYAGNVLASSGSFLNVLPSFYTNNATALGGSATTFFANYIAASTLIASNPITTNKATNLYIQSNVILGANQSINYNSSLALGFVANNTGSSLNYQIAFERSDNNAYAGVYIENTSNKLTFVNGSLNAGINMFTTVNSPLTLSNIPSSTNVTPTAYAQFNSSTSNFYSTTDATNLSSGSVVLSGGLTVNKTILTAGLAVNYTNITPTNGSTITVNSNVSGVVLALTSGLTNLTINLPITNIIDGKLLFITTNQNVTNVTLGNAVLPTTSLSSIAPSLRFLFVASQSLWYSI